MINKLNALSAFARVMLSGAVVALLVMAAPSAVLAADLIIRDEDFSGLCNSGSDWQAYNYICTTENVPSGYNYIVRQDGTESALFLMQSFDYPLTSGETYTLNVMCKGLLRVLINNSDGDGAYTEDLNCGSEFAIKTINATAISEELPITHIIISAQTVSDTGELAGLYLVDPSSNLTGNFDAANVFEVAGDVLTLFGPVIAILAGVGLGFVIYAYLIRALRSR